MNTKSQDTSVVLVHGGFVDGSGWQGVYDILKKDGYDVTIVQNPTVTLEGDVAATQQVLSAQDKPVVLVGHSYGGVVITEAGTDPKVKALVYITAFAPDKGESVQSLIADPPPGPVPPILPPATATCSWTARSSTKLSRATCPLSRLSSWPTRRSHGVSMPWVEPSANPPGGSSRAGTSWPRTTT